MAFLLKFARHSQKLSTISCSRRLLSTTKCCFEREDIVPKPSSTTPMRFGSHQNAQQSGIQNYQNQRLDNRLNKLDMNSRRFGRIARRDVDELFNEIKSSGQATSSQCLLAVRCCGNLLPDEHFETRTKLVTDIWNTLEKLGCPLDVSHYNALLKVYLENEHKFNPTEFLTTMEVKGVASNRVTYQRLVSHYCQKGDIVGAGKILEFMKEQALPINENVFNALITGHARNNDMESAKGILEVMRNAKVEPGNDTFATLLYAYAEKGDIENMREVFQDIESQDIFLLDEHYLEMIYLLAKNGHKQYVDEIIRKLRKFAGFNQDTTSVILRLVNCEEDDVAYKLLKVMPLMTTPDGSQAPSGNFIIRQLVREKRPVDKILALCADMKEEGINSGGLHKATEIALVYGKTDHAIAFIQEMKNQNLPVRCHYFWPILVTMKNDKADESKIFEIVDMMMAMGCPSTFTTFADYVYPALNTTDYRTLISKFKDMGYTTGACVSPLVEYYVTKNDLKAAVELLEEYFVKLNSGSLLRPLAAALRDTNDLKSALMILHRMSDGAEREVQGRIDVIGQFLMDYCRTVDGNHTLITTLLEALVARNFKASIEKCESIKNYLRLAKGDVISELLTKLSTGSGDIVFDDAESSGLPHPREMSVDELEAHLIELKNKNMNTRGVLRKLLLHHCRSKNLARVEEIKAELDVQGFLFSAGMYAQLLDLYVHHDKFEAAKKFLDQIVENQPDFLLDDQKIMNFATLMIKEDKLDEALKFINEQPVNPILSKSDMSAWRLLSTAAEKGDNAFTQQVFDAIVQRKFSEPNNVVLGPLVKGFIINNDIAGAIVKFEECCKNYRCTPWRNQLFSLLIEKEDPDNLQKVMDLNTEIHGEMNTLHDLAFTFLECGRFREARKILESSGLRAKQARLDSACVRLIEEDKVKELEELVSMTKELFDIDRDKMYLFLLKAYRKEKNPDKALGVWTLMQEEDIHPSDRTLIFLADILKEHGRAIPFSVPIINRNPLPMTELASKTVPTEESSPLVQTLLENNVDAALAMKQSMEASGKSVPANELAMLTEALIRQERLNDAVKITNEAMNNSVALPNNVLRFLFLRLANAGKVETIWEFESKLNVELKRSVQFNNIIFQAYISSGRHLEFLDLLEKDVENSHRLAPGGAVLGLLEKHPELVDRVEKLALDYSKHDLNGFLNMVWMYHFRLENYERADKIYNMTPHFRTNLAFGNILQHAEANKDEDMVNRLMNIVKSSSLPQTSLGRIYSSLLEIQCAGQRYDSAEATFKEATSEKVDHLINRLTISKLRTELQKLGKDISVTSRTQ